MNNSELKRQTACKFQSSTRLAIGTVARLDSGTDNCSFLLWSGYWFFPVVKQHLRELGQQTSVKPNQMWIGFLPQTPFPYNLIYFPSNGTVNGSHIKARLFPPLTMHCWNKMHVFETPFLYVFSVFRWIHFVTSAFSFLCCCVRY